MHTKNTAGTNQLTLLPVLLILVFGLSIIMTFATSKPTALLNQLLVQTSLQPFNVDTHLRLAQQYIHLNQKNLAIHELAVSKQLKKTVSVLGQSTLDTRELESQLTQSSQVYAAQKKYWEQVVSEKPNVRDAWVQLVYLSFNQGDILNAQKYLNMISQLDPNFSQYLPDELQQLGH